jgi:hypothetical protein
MSPSAVAQAAASLRGVARRPRWRFGRAADPFLAGALRRTHDDTASAFARRQHRSLRLVTVGFENALDQLQVEAAHQLGILARELME